MNRRSFAAAWASSVRIDDPANTGVRVAQIIGGDVEKNISNPDPAQRWSNACAARTRYILNQSGVAIPGIPGQTVSGAGKRPSFFRVRNLIAFFEQRWGKPEIVRYPPSGGGALAGRKA